MSSSSETSFLEYLLYGVQKSLAKMAVSTGSAFGPFQVQFPRDSGCKRVSSEAFDRMFQAMRCLMNTAFTKAMGAIEGNLERDVFGEYFNG